MKLFKMSLLFILSIFILQILSKSSKAGEFTKNISIEPREIQNWEKGKKYALIIGISKYKYGKDKQEDLKDNKKDILNLKYTVNDAKAIAEFLKNGNSIKYDEVILLTDSDATRDNILQRLTDISNKIGPEDTFVMYYSGHGKEKYLIPYDGNKEYLKATCVRWGEDILPEINSMPAKRKILIVDSCHSGSLTSPEMIAMKGTIEQNSIDENLLSQMGQGLFVISSSRVDEVSWENEKIKHGYFTYNLIEGLKGEADKTDKRSFGNNDDYVTADELYNYVSYKTNEDVLRDYNSPQHPRKSFQGEGIIYLSKVESGEESKIKELHEELISKKAALKALELKEQEVIEKQKADQLRLEKLELEKKIKEKENKLAKEQQKADELENERKQKEKEQKLTEVPMNIGKKYVPNVIIKDLDGKDNELKTFVNGKLTILTFWATWCPSCRKELADLEKNYAKYKVNGLQIIAVSVDENIDDVIKFSKENNLSIKVLMSNANIISAYGGIEAIPVAFILDTEGKIKSKIVGFNPKFEEEIKKYLGIK